MKKLFAKFLILFVIFSFCSCGGKKYATDECGCFFDFDDAKYLAKKKGTDFLVVITNDGDDELSSYFIKSVLKSPDFKTSVLKKYNVIHFDFSQKTYAKTQVGEGATEEMLKQAELIQRTASKGFLISRKLNCQSAPSIYRFSKNGFFVSEVVIEKDDYSVLNFVKQVEASDKKSLELEEQYKATKEGSVVERMKKIDSLFTSFNLVEKSFADVLIKDAISIDKTNESGLVVKYLMQDVDNITTDLCNEKKFSEAAELYYKLAQNELVDTDTKINCYFYAAYILAMTNDMEQIPQILKYLEAGKALNPESDAAIEFDDMYNYFKELSESAE